MQEIAEEAIEEAMDGAEGRGDGDTTTRSGGSKRVLCVAVGDRADEAANRVLARMVRRIGVDADSIGAGALPSEVVDAVDRVGIGVVALSVVPPLSTRDGRYLCRCLRTRYPDIPIIVGIWQNSDPGPLAERFHNDGGTYIATKLSTAVKRIRQYACAAGAPSEERMSLHRIDGEDDAGKPTQSTLNSAH
jgi:hypothetical protein